MMVTIERNIASEVILFLNKTLANPYYLFNFRRADGCSDMAFVFANESECIDYQFFNLEIDLPAQVYTVDVYEQIDYSNLDPAMALFLERIYVKINFVSECQ